MAKRTITLTATETRAAQHAQASGRVAALESERAAVVRQLVALDDRIAAARADYDAALRQILIDRAESVGAGDPVTAAPEMRDVDVVEAYSDTEVVPAAAGGEPVVRRVQKTRTVKKQEPTGRITITFGA